MLGALIVLILRGGQEGFKFTRVCMKVHCAGFLKIISPVIKIPNFGGDKISGPGRPRPEVEGVFAVRPPWVYRRGAA